LIMRAVIQRVKERKQDIKTLVDLGRYFSIFAPRQSGKTTFFEDFCHELEKDAAYVAILLSFQDYKAIDVATFYTLIQKVIYEQLLRRLREVNCKNIEAVHTLLSTHHISFRKLFEKLNTVIPPKRIIIFIDEFDGIPHRRIGKFSDNLKRTLSKIQKANR